MKNKLLKTLISGSVALALMLPTSIAFAAQTVAPYVSNIKVVNNVSGTSDTITVSGVNAGDVVKVYPDASTTNPLTTAAVGAGQTSVTLTVSQLGTASGVIYVTDTSGANSESKRTSKQYASEPSTSSLDPSQITVINNPSGTLDTVTVVNINPSDTIKVYQDPLDTSIKGSAIVASGQTSAIVNISQLGSTAGAVYITITSGSYAESQRTYKTYAAEVATVMIPSSNITIVNNITGTNDTVSVKNIIAGDIVKVYSSQLDASPLGTGTVASGQSSISISIPQLGTDAGISWISLTRGAMAESSRSAKSFIAEPTTSAPINNEVTVINNSTGTNDVITINNLNPTDIIRIYPDATTATPVVMTTAGKNQIPAFTKWNLSSTAIVTSNTTLTLVATGSGQTSYYDIPVLPSQSYAYQVGNANAGTVNIKTLDLNKNPISTKFSSTSTAITTTFTTEANAAYARVELTNTSAGTFVFTNNQLEIGSTVTTFEPMATIVNKNLLPPLSAWQINPYGTITGDYTLTLNASSSNLASTVKAKVSPNTQYTYSAVHNGQITITALDTNSNPISTPVTASSSQSASFTTPSSAAYISFALTNGGQGVFTFAKLQLELGSHATEHEPQSQPLVSATIKIPQLGQAQGSIYYSIQKPGSAQSGRLSRSYGAEEPTQALSYTAIKVVNNASGVSDTVSVFGLNANDVVKVYSGQVGSNLLGTATVSSGTSNTTVSIAQLGSTQGIVYITVTTSGKTESIRVAKSYSAE